MSSMRVWRRVAPPSVQGFHSLPERRNKHARLGATFLAVLIGVAVATTTSLAGAGEPPAPASTAQAAGGDDPATLAGQLAALADATASQWSGHELAKGGFDDPVLGRVVGNYGVSMTGEAMVQAGVDSGNQSLIKDGLTAELSEVAHADDGGFELLSLSDAYSYNETNLAGNAAWIAAEPRLAAYLSRHGPTISDEGLCYTSPHCYTNLKLVSAVAELSLLATGLSGDGPHALLAHTAALRSQTLGWLAMAVSNTGSDAYRAGSDPFAGAGILSDPNENPLAYHALSTLMLGEAILMLGAQTTPEQIAAFYRAAEALVGLIAPDGDDTYIGRGQGQVWTVAATIDALAIAAELTADTAWRGTYLNAATTELGRLQLLYPSHGWGFPLVPRFATGGVPTSYVGIDHYASTVEYNGLALWALDDAAAQIANAQSAPAQPLPSDGDGAFVDPSHAQFAAVTHGGLWFAVHAIDSNPGDARYGFGLVAAELDTADGWQPAFPARPLTDAPTIGGLAMLSHHKTLYPIGRAMSASSAGQVTVNGGWQKGNKLVDPGSVWTFAPATTGEGVTLSFVAAPGAAYAIQVWYEAGAQLSRTQQGVTVVEPAGATQSYLLNVRVHIASSGRASSAYAAGLKSLVLTIPASDAARHITCTTLLATSGSGTSGSTGTSGSSDGKGSSGASGSSGG
jgi:hypothetical protein